METNTGAKIAIRTPLDRFDLDVDIELSSSVVGIFGPSGSGKTSFLESLLGLRPRARGYIRIGEQVWLDTPKGECVPTEKRSIGYVPQELLLIGSRTARQNIAFSRRRAERRGRNFDKELERAVEALGLQGLLDTSVERLSGGEKQRVAIARAVCSAPSLLLLDEPLAALDPALRAKAIHFLRVLLEAYAIPTFMVSHNPTDLRLLCGEALALSKGRLVAQDSSQRVFLAADVFAAARASGYENLLEGKVVEAENGSCKVSLATDGSAPSFVFLNSAELGVGEQVTIGVGASDIILSTEEPCFLSARNCLSGIVTVVSKMDTICLVELSLSGVKQALAVEVTPVSVREMDLREATKVYALFKANGLSILSRSAS